MSSPNLKICSYEEALDELYKYRTAAGEPGRYLGYDCLSKFYSHKDAGVTDWTGFPGSGKTYLCLQLLMNLSIRYNQKHMLFVPDIGSRKEVYSKLIKMKSGFDLNNKYENLIPEDKLATNLTWVYNHFIILEKKDYKKGVRPIEFWEMVCDYKGPQGEIVNTGLIDSWKNMRHDYSGREDVYLDEVLAIRNEMSEIYNKHFHTIAHAVKTDMIGEKGSGKRRIPTAWDIKGGGSWYANGKNIITVDLPNKFRTEVDIYISKVKPEDVGTVGQVVGKMKLNPKKGQYYEVVTGQNYYPFEYLDNPPIVEIPFEKKQVEINIEPVKDLPF